MRLVLVAAVAISLPCAAEEGEKIDAMANPFKPEIYSARYTHHFAETCVEQNLQSKWFVEGSGELLDYCLCLADAWMAKENENDDIRDFCRIRARKFLQQVSRFTKAVEERKATQKKAAKPALKP